MPACPTPAALRSIPACAGELIQVSRMPDTAEVYPHYPAASVSPGVCVELVESGCPSVGWCLLMVG